MNTFYQLLSRLNIVRIFIIIILLTGIISCNNDDVVSLRKFPHPYKAALTICSDIDETDTIEEFLEIQKFLNTSEETAFGQGIGLEIGNSFWFYNQFSELKDSGLSDDSLTALFGPGKLDYGISVFAGTSDSLSSYAPILLALIKAGYIDCLHSYGHFGKDGFTRKLATQAIELMKKESVTVDVFINHGSRMNEHNIGDASSYLGDNPEASCYHTDLTLPAGIKFLWRSHITHCIGQDGDFSFVNTAKCIYEYMQDLFYKDHSFPHDNKLVHIYELDDGQKIFEFVRYINPWGKYSSATEPYIGNQLGEKEVDKLIDNRGYLIFYTHLGINNNPPYLHESTIKALRYIKEKYDRGDLFVTTTSKLLNYYVHRKYLYWRYDQKSDSVFITIDSISNEVEGSYVPTEYDLEGLTFYIPENKKVRLTIGKQSVSFIYNGKDKSGKESISIPWKHLTFPNLQN